MTSALESSQRTSSSTSMSRKLAINGGPRAVRGRVRDRWRPVRWSDAWPILFSIARGRTRDPSGKVTAKFEGRFAKVTGSKHALFMNSGTATLHSGLFAVGVGPGDEVIVPSYTYHASVGAVLCCGATPVFCDIDSATLTADPADIRRRITNRTKAIMPVHVWGNPAEMDPIRAIAEEHNLFIVEDCSHAHGATYDGVSVGKWGHVGCFSLQGSKPVSGGEAGIAVTDDADLFDRMIALGQPVRAINGLKKNDYQLGAMNLGPKYRPHLFAVQLASRSLNRHDQLNRLRTRNWQILCDVLQDETGIRPPATLPKAKRGGFFEFKLVLDEGIDSDIFIRAAQAEGVPVRKDRYGFLHDNPFFQNGGPLTVAILETEREQVSGVRCQVSRENDSSHLEPRTSHLLPNTEALRNRILTLPPFTKVPETTVRQCAEGLKKVASVLDVR